MRTTIDPQALSWLAGQLRWERLHDELRRDAGEPVVAVDAVERPRAA